MRRSRLAGFVLLALPLGFTRPAPAARVVTNEKSDDVTFIDAATRAVVGTVSAASAARRHREPDGKRVYSEQRKLGSLSVIDAKTSRC